MNERAIGRDTIVVGTCECGGYGITYNANTRRELGRCHDPLIPNPETVGQGAQRRQRVLGSNVERLMVERGMTYRGAMRAFGLRSTSAVANIVHGRVDCRTSTLWAIADFFGVSIANLYEGA